MVWRIIYSLLPVHWSGFVDFLAYISAIFYPACTLRGFFLAHIYFLHLIRIILTARIFSKLLSIL
jgi:hypothetical protein